MKRWLIALLCVSALALSAAEALVWKGAGALSQWEPKRVEAEIANSNLVLYVENVDAQLQLSGLELDTGLYNTFSFRYRAEKTPKSGGQLFFRKKDTNYNDNHYWRLPELIADGKWHTTTVTAQNLIIADSWDKMGAVEALRFDPTDAAGGKIEISEIKLSWTGSGKPTPHLTAPKALKAPAKAPASRPQAQPKPADKPKAAVKPPAGPHYTEWNKENDFAGWFAKTNTKAEKTADGVKLYLTGRDSQYQNSSVWFEQSKFNTVTITYRAEGMSGARGQFYVGTTDNPVHEHGCWDIGPFINDGKWHEMVLQADQIGDFSVWTGKATVNALRFDPSDGEGGWIELKSIKLGYDVTANTLPETAAGLDTVPWPKLETDYLNEYKGNMRGAYFLGKMVSSPLDLKGEGKYTTFYLRREFTAKKAIKFAAIQFVGDDGVDVYLNGKKVAANRQWKEVTSTEITHALKPGSNVWGMVYTNTDNVGGAFGEIFIRYTDNTSEKISTDEAFVCNIKAPEDGSWAKPGFDASHWTAVVAKPGPPNAPWLMRLDYHNFTAGGKLESAAIQPQTVTAGNKIRLTARFSGEAVALPVDIKFEIYNLDTQKLVWREYVPMDSKMMQSMGKDGWRLSMDYVTPLYLSSIKNAALRFSVNGISGSSDLKFHYQEITEDPTCPPLPPVTVKQVPGYGPAFMLGDKPMFLLWGGTCNIIYGRNPDDGKISNAPFNVVTAHNRVSEWWPTTDTFDPEPFDRTAELYRRAHPDAYFIWDLTFRFPGDWARRYPDDMCLDEKGEVVKDGMCFSYSSKQALKDLLRMVEKTVTYLENSPYRNRIIAYRINAGHTIEWLGWSPVGGRSVDFSKASREGFKAFAQKRYPELKNFDIPTYEEHTALDNERLLWDNKTHLREQAYAEYLSESIADMVIAANLKAKELVKGKKAVGTYYAYTMTLNDSGVSRHRGHFAAKKLFESGAVDFLMSPQTYCIRRPGDGYGDMKPFASLNANNIVPILEDDTRTHSGESGLGYHQTHNLTETLNIMRRNMGFTLCRQQSGYYYSLTGSKMLFVPELERDMAKFRTVGEYCLEKRVERHAEIALVTSEKNITHQPSRARSALTGELEQAYNADGTPSVNPVGGRIVASEIYNRIMNRFSRSGAPVDLMLGEDFADHPGDYKLYVFVNAYEYDAKFLAKIEELRKKPGVTLLWLYAPGYIKDFQGSLESMKTLTGFTFQEAPKPMCPAVQTVKDNKRWMGMRTTRVAPLFAVTNPDAEVLGTYEDGSAGLAVMKAANGAQSVFYGGWQLDMAGIQEIARLAGVRLYMDSTDPMEANDALIAVHTRIPGQKTVKLPRKTDVIEVFTGKVIGKGIDTFTFDAPLHSSWLFYYGDDAETLLGKLK